MTAFLLVPFPGIEFALEPGDLAAQRLQLGARSGDLRGDVAGMGDAKALVGGIPARHQLLFLIPPRLSSVHRSRKSPVARALRCQPSSRLDTGMEIPAGMSSLGMPWCTSAAGCGGVAPFFGR